MFENTRIYTRRHMYTVGNTHINIDSGFPGVRAQTTQRIGSRILS